MCGTFLCRTPSAGLRLAFGAARAQNRIAQGCAGAAQHRDVRERPSRRFCRTQWFQICRPAASYKNGPKGAFLVSGGEGGIDSKRGGRPRFDPFGQHSWPTGRLRRSQSLTRLVEPGALRAPWVLIEPPALPATKKAPGGTFLVSGGEGGIRTHGTPKRTTDFESAPFDHSGTSPHGRRMLAFLAAKFHVLFAIRLFSSPKYDRMTSLASIRDNRRDCLRIDICRQIISRTGNAASRVAGRGGWPRRAMRCSSKRVYSRSPIPVKSRYRCSARRKPVGNASPALSARRCRC